MTDATDPNDTEALLRELLPDTDERSDGRDAGGEPSTSVGAEAHEAAIVTAARTTAEVPLGRDPERPTATGTWGGRGRTLGVLVGVLLALAVAGVAWLLAGDDEQVAANDAASAGETDPSESPSTASSSNASLPTTVAGDAGLSRTDASQDGEGPDYRVPELQVDPELGFVVGGEDIQGRPIPALPDELVPNTENAEDLPYYVPDPTGVPETGPYTVIKGGWFFLRGTLSSENVRQEIVRRNLLFLPPEQVVVEITIDPNNTWYFGDPIPAFLEDKLLFASDSAEINEDFIGLFELGANLIKLDPRITITLIGHTDDEGDADYNQQLSEDRVNAVRDYYIGFGADPDRVIVIGKGESEPIADNSTAEGRAVNRRVETIVTSTEGEGNAGTAPAADG